MQIVHRVYASSWADFKSNIWCKKVKKHNASKCHSSTNCCIFLFFSQHINFEKAFFFKGCGCGSWTCFRRNGRDRHCSSVCRTKLSSSCTQSCSVCSASASLQTAVRDIIIGSEPLPQFIEQIFTEEPTEFINKTYSQMESILKRDSKKRDLFDRKLESSTEVLCESGYLLKVEFRCLRTHSPSGYRFWFNDQVHDTLIYLFQVNNLLFYAGYKLRWTINYQPE